MTLSCHWLTAFITLSWGSPWLCTHNLDDGRVTIGSFWASSNLFKNQQHHLLLLSQMLPHGICLIRPRRPYSSYTDLLPDTFPPKGRLYIPHPASRAWPLRNALVSSAPSRRHLLPLLLPLDSSIWKRTIRKREKRRVMHLLL